MQTVAIADHGIEAVVAMEMKVGGCAVGEGERGRGVGGRGMFVCGFLGEAVVHVVAVRGERE